MRTFCGFLALITQLLCLQIPLFWYIILMYHSARTTSLKMICFSNPGLSIKADLLSYFLVATVALVANVLVDCKCSPGLASWPALDQWETLNMTIQGRLIKIVNQEASAILDG